MRRQINAPADIMKICCSVIEFNPALKTFILTMELCKHRGSHLIKKNHKRWLATDLESDRNLFGRTVLEDFSFSMARQPLVGQGLPIIEVSRSQSEAPHLSGLLWTSDQSQAETSTSQYTTLREERHLCPWQDSNPQSRHVSGRKLTP